MDKYEILADFLNSELSENTNKLVVNANTCIAFGADKTSVEQSDLFSELKSETLIDRHIKDDFVKEAFISGASELDKPIFVRGKNHAYIVDNEKKLILCEYSYIDKKPEIARGETIDTILKFIETHQDDFLYVEYYLED